LILEFIDSGLPAGSQWVNRKYRLTRATDVKKVRRFGKSFAHPLVVLVMMPGSPEKTLIGVIAGRSVGNAVLRNRAKRLLRESIRPLLKDIPPGYHLVFIARQGAPRADFHEIQSAVQNVLERAKLLKVVHES